MLADDLLSPNQQVEQNFGMHEDLSINELIDWERSTATARL